MTAACALSSVAMVTKRAEEQREIAQMLQEIEATPTGAKAVNDLRQQRFRVRYGRPLGGGAFTYPWKVITIRRGYSRHVTRSMLIHEVGHASFIAESGRIWSGSVEQEYAANRFWAQVSRELDALSGGEQIKWFGQGHDRSALYDEIRHTSTWHRLSLPVHQPRGLLDKLWSVWQAIASAVWIVRLLRPGYLRPRRRRAGHAPREQGSAQDH
jgi:hypothetical protein